MIVSRVENYLPEELLPAGFVYPAGYRRLVEKDPVFMGLTPWNFMSLLADRHRFYSDRMGEPLIPFAQAYGWDMLAFFEGRATSDPRVVLYSLDPERCMSPIVQRLKNFDEWLEYAKRDAANYRLENPDEFEEESK